MSNQFPDGMTDRYDPFPEDGWMDDYPDDYDLISKELENTQAEGCLPPNKEEIVQPGASCASTGASMRVFSTGATRDQDVNKIDLEGFLSPIALQRYGAYMLKHQVQADGQIRASDNWQKGIPLEAYMKSMFRHFMDVWLEMRGFESREGIEEGLCALLFNVQGMLHEIVKGGK